ncbi:MAG TPA: FAD-binding oxidoreductase [Candidatus Methylomirabilis sp.]|nr:FAD-binding oxidoreductase [Candidatus Methylomirabilis sp.]
METADVIVIGGGVIGGACAYHLARAGARVTLLEKYEIAAGASGGSAGGVRQQNRAAPELPLAMAANPMWKTLEGELGTDLEYRRGGHLTLAEHEEQLPALEAAVERQRGRGLDIRMVRGSELRDLVPAAGPQILAGSYSPGDGFANPMLVTKAFPAAARRLGAKIYTRTAVTAIRREGARVIGVDSTRGPVLSRFVINAAGAWAPGLSSGLGVDLPVRPMALQMMVTEKAPPILRPVLGCLGRGLSLKQMPQGQFVIGGGWPGIPDMVADRGWPKIGSPNGSACQVTAVLPVTQGLLVLRVWNSLEAKTIDELPILGEVDGLQGYLLATGFSGHGFALAPVVGALMAESITTGKPSLSLDQLNLRRFAGYDPDRIREFLTPDRVEGIGTGTISA